MRLPDGEKGALLRVRGRRDPQTGGAQSFSGLTQVTIHGVAEAEEDLNDAIRRELGEELKEMLKAKGERHDADRIKTTLLRHFPRRLHALSRRDTGVERVITLGCIINQEEALQCIEPLLKTNQLRIVRSTDLPDVRTIDPYDSALRDVHISADDIAMFPDEYQALKRAFDMPAEA